ncbi:MAG: TfoX/Sxy family protein, partial [Alphaproteobacteria bacterium]
MALSPEYSAFVEELFAFAFPVRIRRMFGGAGIFWDEVMIGLISDERIYLKA